MNKNNIGIALRMLLLFGSIYCLVLTVDWINNLNFTKELFWKIIFILFVIPCSIPFFIIAFKIALTYHPSRKFSERDYYSEKQIRFPVGEEIKNDFIGYKESIKIEPPVVKKEEIQTQTDELQGEEREKLKKALKSKGNVFVFKEDLILTERERKRRDLNNKFWNSELYPDDYTPVKQGIVSLHEKKEKI